VAVQINGDDAALARQFRERRFEHADVAEAPVEH
jgi:hypothetical protein